MLFRLGVNTHNNDSENSRQQNFPDIPTDHAATRSVTESTLKETATRGDTLMEMSFNAFV